MPLAPRRRIPTTLAWLSLWVVVTAAASPAAALLTIDFEQKYYVHPEMQVWDLCLIQHEDLFYLFYHGIPEANPSAANADNIWLATSEDLIYWSEPQIVLSVSDAPHEELAIWAPSVVHDDETGLWWMAYTGVDLGYSQRICMAWSRDLVTWYKHRDNPVLEPDPQFYFYPSQTGYAECRDPFLYRGDDGLWHMLVSAKLLGISGGRGVIARSRSNDLLNWSPLEPFVANTGLNPVNTLESAQYLVVDGIHHVFFHEYATIGLSHLSTADPAVWNYETRAIIDNGIAPEVASYDGGENYLLTRIGAYIEPGANVFSWVARIDTLRFRGGPAAPDVHKPHPLARDFAVFSGSSTLGNPCFGDNPARRGETPAGPVGHFYFGSKEYFQGPLSGRGDAGIQIGLPAQGFLETPPFIIKGNAINMLVGGTDAIDLCYVALVCADADTILRKTTGHGVETMAPRSWDVSDLLGRPVVLRIVDANPFGFINVDEIRESLAYTTTAPPAVTPPDVMVHDLGPRPNPFNPATTLRFELPFAAPYRVRIHDLRGRLVWDSGHRQAQAGPNSVDWHGTSAAGTAVAGGMYVYRIEAAGMVAATGKLTLLP